jgi:hypothetical protein
MCPDLPWLGKLNILILRVESSAEGRFHEIQDLLTNPKRGCLDPENSTLERCLGKASDYFIYTYGRLGFKCFWGP